MRYESDNAVMQIKSDEDAESLAHAIEADWAARKYFLGAAFDKRTDQFVAQIYIGVVNWELPEFQIGFFVDRDHEGKGYATEAARATLAFVFRYLGAHRVSAECDETNVRSCRVLERCGMAREGLSRENKKNSDGTISGTMHFAILRHEFEHSQRGDCR